MMRQFLSRFLLIVLLLAAGISAIFGFNYWRSQSFITRHQGGLIVLGDSHAATNINPGILGAANYGHTAEPLLATAQKLEWITTNLQPDTVLLVLSPNNFAGYNDHKFSDEQWSSEMAKRYFSLFPWEFWAHYNDAPTSLGHHFRKQLLPNPTGKPAFLGKYAPKPVKNDLGDLNAVLNRHFNPSYDAVSQASHEALQAIVQTCEYNDIALFAIEAPLLPEYKNQIPNEVLQAFSRALSIIPRLEVSISLSENQFFNGDHLNKDGAEIYSSALKKALAKK